MMISAELEYAFVSTPKCGTHTMYEVLRTQFHGERFREFHDRHLPGKARDWTRFTVVRNPYSRAVSIWQWALKSKNSGRIIGPIPLGFEKFTFWLNETTTGWLPRFPIHEWLAEVDLTHVLHIENLAEEFAALPFVDEPIEFPTLNVSEHKPWQDYMTPTAVENVRRWAGKDFTEYGYPIEIR